jgi:hypothetical protein
MLRFAFWLFLVPALILCAVSEKAFSEINAQNQKIFQQTPKALTLKLANGISGKTDDRIDLICRSDGLFGFYFYETDRPKAGDKLFIVGTRRFADKIYFGNDVGRPIRSEVELQYDLTKSAFFDEESKRNWFILPSVFRNRSLQANDNSFARVQRAHSLFLVSQLQMLFAEYVVVSRASGDTRIYKVDPAGIDNSFFRDCWRLTGFEETTQTLRVLDRGMRPPGTAGSGVCQSHVLLIASIQGLLDSIPNAKNPNYKWQKGHEDTYRYFYSDKIAKTGLLDFLDDCRRSQNLERSHLISMLAASPKIDFSEIARLASLINNPSPATIEYMVQRFNLPINDDQRAVLKRREAEKVSNGIRSTYLSYLTIKDCYEMRVNSLFQYISRAEFESLRKQMSVFEKKISEEGIDAKPIWDEAIKAWQENENVRMLLQNLGHNDGVQGVCTLAKIELANFLRSIVGPREIKKDF